MTEGPSSRQRSPPAASGVPETTVPGVEPDPRAPSSEPEAERAAELGAGSAGAGMRSSVASALVAGGILLSRIAGLVRERVIATYFGTGLHADVFSAGLRMPNLLQNLLGEGTLSASFIPVYSELLGRGRTAEAGRVAGAMFALLACIAGGVSLLGVALAPYIVSVFTPGFSGARRELTIAVVRIVFPMAGVLVLSAWALGILNSHRKFFVPYFAPVLWNVAIIATLLMFGSSVEPDALLIAVAWGALVGGALQFAVQLPWVLRLDRQIRLNSGRGLPGFAEAVRNAGPAILGRGVVQIGTYVDVVLASLLAVGALARLRYAQTLYVLPISLFGISVAAAELPELARERAGAVEQLRQRSVAALRRVCFFVLPSGIAFVLLGEIFVAGLYQSGEFDAADARVVWLTLAAYALGLPASACTRVYQSAFFALRDTKTPARIAGVRMLTSATAGALLMLQFEPVAGGALGLPTGAFAGANVDGVPLGPVGLALGSACGAGMEWLLLRRRLQGRLGRIAVGSAQLARIGAACVAGAAAGLFAGVALTSLAPLPRAGAVGLAFGAGYIGAALALRLGEARALTDALRRRVRRR